MRNAYARLDEEEEEEDDAVSYIAGAIDGRPRFARARARVSGLRAFPALMRGVDDGGRRVTQVHRRMIRLRTVTYYWPYTEPLARVSGFPF